MIHQSQTDKNFKKYFLVFLILHFLLAILFIFGMPSFDFKKRPDLTIELSVLAPSLGGEQSIMQRLSTPQKFVKKEDQQLLPKDKEGTQLKESPQVSSASSASSSAGPAIAPSSDADYKASNLKNPVPPYPPLAVKMRLEGRVTLLVEVLPNGRAGKVSIESSSGHDLLDQSALQTVKQWQFTPAKKDGVITTQVVRIPVNFNLKSR